MKILVLAGGYDQIALINELKKRGHLVILVDYFENPPAKNYADKHIVASTLDTVLVEEIAQKEKVDLICTACTDQALLTVAKVSEKLNLPCYISYQTALNVTNKSYMKKVLEENNIPTAKFVILDKCNNNFLSNFSYPLVVKPVDCNSSKGVKRVSNNNELEKYLNEAIQYSRTRTAIVEEFKDGEEISADFYIEGDNAIFLSATRSFKIHNKKTFTILGSEYPAITEEQKSSIIEIANRIAKAFVLHDTPLLIQFIIKGNDINVIEFSARMGGGSKYKLIEVLTGENIMKKYVDLILGGKPSFIPHKQVNYCRMVYLYCTPGTLYKVEGLEELKQKDVIKEYFLYKTVGMTIEKAETSGDRPAGYLVTAETEKELFDKIKFADSHIQVISETGEDIMIHKLVV